jgi:hypothetical protein
MDELVKMVSQKTGLTEDQSRQAAQAVIGYLKTKLPAPIAGQIDGILASTGAVKDVVGQAQGAAGMFGKK